MASNRELQQLAEAGADELNALCIDLASGLGQRIIEAQAGMRSSGFEAHARGGATSDPTVALALRGADLARLHHAEMERLLRRIATAARRAAEIGRLYPAPRVATDDDRRVLERVNGTKAQGCASCARVSASDGLPRWEPTDLRLAGPTDVSGRLSAPMWLCRWCVDRVSQWGRLPTPEELRCHHERGRVPWPDDVERPQ